MIDPARDKGARVDRRLRSDRILSVGAVRADGRPRAVPVWFWWDGAAIPIFTEGDSQPARNPFAHPNLILVLDNTKFGCGSDRRGDDGTAVAAVGRRRSSHLLGEIRRRHRRPRYHR